MFFFYKFVVFKWIDRIKKWVEVIREDTRGCGVYEGDDGYEGYVEGKIKSNEFAWDDSED